MSLFINLLRKSFLSAISKGDISTSGYPTTSTSGHSASEKLSSTADSSFRSSSSSSSSELKGLRFDFDKTSSLMEQEDHSAFRLSFSSTMADATAELDAKPDPTAGCTPFAYKSSSSSFSIELNQHAQEGDSFDQISPLGQDTADILNAALLSPDMEDADSPVVDPSQNILEDTQPGPKRIRLSVPSEHEGL